MEHSVPAQTVGDFAIAMRDELDRATAIHGEQWDLPDSLEEPLNAHLREESAKRACDTSFLEKRATYALILLEEVAEAVSAAADGDLDACQEELIQVAAMAFRWHEAINRRAR